MIILATKLIDVALTFGFPVARKIAQAVYKPKFFTAQEWRTVRLLADMVIPKDERSGSATDSGAPEWMDFMMAYETTSDASTRSVMRS